MKYDLDTWDVVWHVKHTSSSSLWITCSPKRIETEEPSVSKCIYLDQENIDMLTMAASESEKN